MRLRARPPPAAPDPAGPVAARSAPAQGRASGCPPQPAHGKGRSATRCLGRRWRPSSQTAPPPPPPRRPPLLLRASPGSARPSQQPWPGCWPSGAARGPRRAPRGAGRLPSLGSGAARAGQSPDQTLATETPVGGRVAARGASDLMHGRQVSNLVALVDLHILLCRRAPACQCKRRSNPWRSALLPPPALAHCGSSAPQTYREFIAMACSGLARLARPVAACSRALRPLAGLAR